MRKLSRQNCARSSGHPCPCGANPPISVRHIGNRRPAPPCSGALVAAALGAAACCLPTAADTPLTLVANGVSPYVIVVPPDAVQGPVAAAQELQTYIAKTSGAALPIVHAPPVDGPAIYVGTSAWARQRGVDTTAFGPQEFAMRTAGRDLVLAGPDQAGDPWHMGWSKVWSTPTLFAADTFLERCLGVHWYWPGDLGEEVPKRATLVVPAMDVRERPSIDVREIEMDATQPLISRWMVRNRIGEAPKIIHWHNWWRIMPESEFYATHPEYFAQVDGKRGVGDGATGYVWGHQLCTTNPDVRRIFTQRVIDYFDKNPTMESQSISPNDGGHHCQCDTCRALDVAANPDGSPILTDRIFAFYNAVAQGVAEKYPHKWLGCYAYDEYAAPSPRVKPQPNLFVFDVHNFAGNLLCDANYRAAVYRDTALWRAASPNVALYTAFYYDPYAIENLPVDSGSVLPDLLRHLKQCGGRGIMFSVPSGDVREEYLAAHELWNVDCDAAALQTDYYHGLFGADAGELVRAYYDLIGSQSKVQAAAILARDGLSKVETDEVNGKLTRALDLYRPIRARLNTLLDQAANLSLTDRQRARLKVVRDNWEFTKLTIDAVDAIDALDRAVASHSDLSKLSLAGTAKLAIETRARFMTEAAKNDPAGLVVAPGAAAAEKTNIYLLPFQPALGRINGLLNFKPRVAHVHAFDGMVPSEAQWAAAPAGTSFVEAFVGGQTQFPTSFRALYNQRALFVRVECAEPDADRVIGTGTTLRDGPVWQDNCVDMFLDPAHDGHHDFHLIANTAGGQFDANDLGQSADASWNGDWKVSVHKGGAGWLADFEIPFSTLQRSAPADGEVWSINVCRVRPSSKEYSAWSPTFGLFHNPSQFGTLVFD